MWRPDLVAASERPNDVCLCPPLQTNLLDPYEPPSSSAQVRQQLARDHETAQKVRNKHKRPSVHCRGVADSISKLT